MTILPETSVSPRGRASKWSVSSRLIAVCYVWATVVVTLILIVSWRSPAPRATMLMASGLLLLWVCLGGAVMMRFRDPIRDWVRGLPGPWRVKFVLFCIALACLEEAVTVSMTNLAPVFGVPMGKAYITASANYFDVILRHSVIVFVPAFIVWAWLLGKYRFHPNAVLLLFGVTGTLAETLTFGAQNLGDLGFWILVYGLMIYLPAYSVPDDRPAKTPGWGTHLTAILLPFPPMIPVAPLLMWLHPTSIHFPPING